MSARPLTVLLLGGYGTFGSRLARRLADTPDLTLIVAGRSADAAARFCAGVPHRAVLKPAKLDRDGDLTSDVRALRPDILVDATGPFRRHGPRPYRVVETCLALGVHYLDLADGSDFVQGISTFDDLAQAKSLVVLAGLSTFPAFSGAVVADLARGLSRVDRITMGVAPSPFVGIGLSVVRAVASYAGKPVRLRRDGRETTGVGLVETRRLTVSPPGRLPLQSRIFSLVDVPDLRLVPDRRPGLDAIWVGVGTLPAAFHWGLRQMARLVRFGLLPSLGPFAALFWRVINRVGWGERRGGFVVVVEGQDAGGGPVMRSWHLIADEDDGPFIPCLAAEAVILSALAGRWPAPGARPASDAVRLKDLEPLIASLRISSGHRTSSPEQAGQPLYRRILGERWTELPPAVRALHDSNATRRFEGQADVDRGRGLLARILARVFGFPPAGSAIPVSVEFTVRDGTEIWRRTFAGRSFSTVQSEGRGRFEHLVVERFGPFAVGLAPVIGPGRLDIVVRRWSLGPVPLPSWLAPGGETYESDGEGRFCFHVEIAAPLIGLVVRYRGWLVPIG